MKNKSGIFEKIFYNNKLLLVFCIILSITLWTAVKINVSDNTSRTISDVKVTIDTALLEENDFKVFAEEEDLYVDVKVSGKSYNINSYSLTENEIIVEATTGYVDASGYRILNLTGRTTDTDVSVTGITPSTITVFFDKEAKETFNVEAKLTNGAADLSKEGYVVGQPVASMSTVEVSGPASVLEKLNKVYFEATVDETEIPLTVTKEIAADISFDLESERGSQFLLCNGVMAEDDANTATVTIPVYRVKNVKTAVKFINEPKDFDKNNAPVLINPSEVEISYNPKGNEDIETLNVGTVDFRQLDNKVNTLEFVLDAKTSANIINTQQSVFTVTVDMSGMSKRVFEEVPGKIVALNSKDGYDYSVSLTNGGLNNIVIIGPKESLDKITVDDLQVEVNVSSLNVDKKTPQKAEVSNISIISEDINDCWVYGSYNSFITVKKR